MSETLFDASIYGLAEGETLLGKLSGLAGGSLQTAVGFALGFAASNALGPLATELEQVAWAALQIRALDPGTAAEIVAEDVKKRDWGASEASQHGVDGERFDAIVGEVLNAPGMGELLAMLRRESITSDEFVHGLRKAKLEMQWDGPVEDLQHERLDPAVIAVSGQRGTMHDAGLLPVGPPTAVGKVPPMPVSDLDPVKEAAASGVNRERLGVMMRNVGLPPGPGELLQLLNRGAIELADFDRGIAEGNTRNEWAQFLVQLRRSLNSPSEYAELRLRGWIDDAAMHAGGALHGREAADMDLLFKLHGRPIPIHQVVTGEARGGKYNGTIGDIPNEFLRSMEEGSARPEWYDLMYANRYTYPSAFVLRSLAQTGAVDEAETHKDLLHLGWRPDLAEKVAKVWHEGTAAKADPHVTKADGHLWTALHKSYVAEESDEAAITPGLHALGVADIATVLSRWNAERSLIHAQLTPAQIKKAAKNLPAVWPRQRALDALLARGYTADEAATLLDE